MIGTTISHYKILSKLGEGGMGVVYKDLGLPNLPFVASTIGEMRADSEDNKRSAVNLILLDLPNQRPQTSCVDARDLKSHIGDFVHFDAAAQQEIGRRFASEYLKLVGH